ncbi:MAG TPA: ATP-binding cassette domain-containing protein [Candidatus Binatia bacterium]
MELFYDVGHVVIMIRVVDLHKTFRQQEVLRGINIEFETGKITTIIGGSGSGKTVLLKHLNALLLPDRGSVLVDGRDITKLGQSALNEVRQKFGMLFQSAALLDSMTLHDNVAFPLRERTRLEEKEIKKRADDSLAQVGLAGMGYKYPAEVSGGMKKRAGLARALVTQPEIMLFDEPTTGLDPLLGKSIHELIRRMHANFHFTGVIVSHDIPQVFKISDRVAMLANGLIIEAGTTEEFTASKNPIVKQFLQGETEGPISVL